jgi:hypothetical protein
MTQRYAIVQQIVALARLPNARRRDIERELREHLEDLADDARAQGHDEAMIERMEAIRFGDPRQIGAAFTSVYALELWTRRAAAGGTLLLTSIATVCLVVGTVQASAALCSGALCAPNSGGLPSEIVGICAVALGYCSAYLGQRLFSSSTARAASLTLLVAICVAAGLILAVPAHAVLPCVAFSCTAFARLLQRVSIPLLWFVGTAAPITVVGLAFRPEMPGQGPPLWLVWIGLTLSCAVLRRVVDRFDKSTCAGILA